MPRYAILALDSFDYILSKTGNALIRYQGENVIGVIDPTQAGKTSDQVLGWGGKIPCVSNFDELKNYGPTHLVIGSAPQGGRINDAYRKEIIAGLKSGCHILNGMHTFLNDDPELLQLAQDNKVTITDFRRPPDPPNFPKGTWKNRKFPVLLIVGSDCDSGKMTTALELVHLLRERNRKVEFIPTGQTGIMLEGNGVAIDAVISDFMAGEIEYCLDQLPDDTELAIVEGQGALNNELYSGVTLGLLHGSMPDYLIFTHEPNRKLDCAGNKFPDLKFLMDSYINLMSPFKDTIYLGINYMTLNLDNSSATKICQVSKNNYGLPVTDLIRFKDKELIENIERAIDIWK
tara:strand:+ start:418 stop:1455 length:1038 start_codon:yes stop_codon:yes gene_type:complete